MRFILISVALCFPIIGFGQTSPTPLASVKEGVYFLQNRGSTTVLELKDRQFRYWFRSDARKPREPAYPLVGTYLTNGGIVTLPHQDIHQSNWTFMLYDGKTTLWRPSALKHWDETKKVDPYGVLFPAAATPEAIWGNKDGDRTAGPQAGLAPLPIKLPPPSWGWNGPQPPAAISPQLEPVGVRPRQPFLAPIGVTNLAFRKPVTTSDPTPLAGDRSAVTDGDKEIRAPDQRGDTMLEMHSGTQWVQIDLGAIYPVHAILIWHDFYLPNTIGQGVVVQAAEDASFTTAVQTLFNNDHNNLLGFGVGKDKQYRETHEGKLIPVKGVRARYIRCYSNGSTKAPSNCYTEVEVWGLPGE